MSVLPSSTAWVRGTWLVMSVDHCRGKVKDDEYYCLDTFMLGLTPSWSRASSTLVALPCFTAVLTIRIGGLMFGRLQTPELCSPEFRAGFRVLLHFAVQVTNQDGSLL